MNKKLFGKICLILSLIIATYIFICDVFMTFSITVTFYFLFMSGLLFLQFLIKKYPINLEEREPSFRYTFINVATILFFSATIMMLIFNLAYKKNILESDKKYDYIVVFGAGVKEGKEEIINSRLSRAIEYADKYTKCRFVLTGAKGEAEPIEEAYYMRNYMKKYGISNDRIIVDPFSVNTYENIKNALELIRIDAIKRNRRENIITRPFQNTENIFDMDFLNIGFMSSEFHITRINLMAKKQGVRKPYDILCDTYWLYRPYMYIRENLSMFKALVLNQLKI